MLVDGTQIWPNTIPPEALATDFLDAILLRDGSVALTGPLNLGGQRITNAGDPVLPTDVALLKNIQAIKWKDSVYAATTTNIVLSGLQPIDGEAVPTAKRVLVRLQDDATENGFYLTSNDAWVRTADGDTGAKLQSAYVSVERGLTLKDHRFAQTADDIVVGDDPIIFVDSGVGAPTAYPTPSNKKMPALATTGNGQLATSTPIAHTPAGHSFIRVFVNGVGQELRSDKTGDCYFSRDGGTTAIAIASIASGDQLYWNQTIARFSLKTYHFICLDYVV